MKFFQACGKRSGCNGTGFGAVSMWGNPLKQLWACLREHI